MNNRHLVFVYGTLKRCGWNNRLLAESEFLGAATTRQHYVMEGSDGSVPRVYDLPDHDDAAPVKGEVWAVDDAGLARLDALEGHPRHYCRKPMTARFDGTVTHAEAWLYFVPHPPWSTRPPVDGVHDWQAAHDNAFTYDTEEEFNGR